MSRGRSPQGLRPQQMALLEALLPEIDARSPAAELDRAAAYLERLERQAAINPAINGPLGAAILAAFRAVAAQWAALPADARPWLCAAMRYFWFVDDEMNDVENFMGFEDDCAVLNACLRAAGQEALVVRQEDYD